MTPFRFLAFALLLLAPLAVPSTAASEPFLAQADGVYRTAEGALVPVAVTWSGPCNGEGVLTVTGSLPGQSWSLPMRSAMAADACEAVGPSCYECPPLVLPVAWTLKGEGARLVGGGAVYVWSTDAWDVAWTMQGPFLGGVLEFHGVIGG
jgi:hypothetical protein